MEIFLVTPSGSGSQMAGQIKREKTKSAQTANASDWFVPPPFFNIEA